MSTKYSIAKKICLGCNKEFKKDGRWTYQYWETREYCRRSCSVSGTRNPFYGKKHSDATKEKLSHIHSGKSNPHVRGNRSHFWKGGVSALNRTKRQNIMRTVEYRHWRKQVFERDNYTCVLCSKVGGELNADHIKPFSLYPELIFNLSNGRTLCSPCHRKTPTYSRKVT